MAKITKHDHDLTNMTDEEIVLLVQRENCKKCSEYLVKKYKNLVGIKSRAYFLVGADKEDIYQEGLVGLYKAIRDYKNNQNATFKSFAAMCITRQIITAIKAATRFKHVPLNTYVSFEKKVYDQDSERRLIDVLVGEKVIDPEALLIDQEEFLLLEKALRKVLSPLEWKVLTRYLNGVKYQDIAEDLNRPLKSIDNALQRIKRKVEIYQKNKAKIIKKGCL